MTEGIYTINPDAAPGHRILVQVRWPAAFVREIDRWRNTLPDIPSRTQAIYQLTALGLAGELLKVNTKDIQERAEELRK